MAGISNTASIAPNPGGEILLSRSVDVSDESDKRETYERVLDGSITLLSFIKDLSESTEVLSPLKATCAVMIRGLEILRGIHRNKHDWKELASRIEEHCISLETQISALEGESWRKSKVMDQLFFDPLLNYVKALEDVLNKAIKESGKARPSVRKSLLRIVDQRREAEAIIECSRLLDGAFKRFMTELQLFTSYHLKQLKDQFNQHVQQVALYQLASVPARGNDHRKCLPGTRSQMLDVIQAWKSAETAEQVFWLADVAGSGKSTIAKHMAEQWQLENCLAARFFFSINAISTSKTDFVCPTLATDLADMFPDIIPSLSNIIRENLTLKSLPFRDQFQKLILPCLEFIIKRNGSPVVLVIDALDECDILGRKEILSVLKHDIPQIPKARVLLTSRPLDDITQDLNNNKAVAGGIYLLSRLSDEANSRDIEAYINDRLFGLDSSMKQRLVARASGLFIWAKLACDILSDTLAVKEDFDDLMSSATGENRLTSIYLAILKSASSSENTKKVLLFVLQLVVTAREPLSISTMESFFPSNNIGPPVQRLGSVLRDGNAFAPVHVIHPTFREFLYSRGSNGFLVQPEIGNELLANACLDMLLSELSDSKSTALTSRRKELNTEGSNQPAKVSPAFEYAAFHWTHHLSSVPDKKHLIAKLHQLLQSKLLNWVEVMSLFNGIYECIQGLSKLRTAIATIPEIDERNKDMCNDAFRFVVAHQTVIQENAWETYCSALAFTPRETEMFKLYFERYKLMMPRILSGVERKWPLHQTLWGHTADVTCVAFSYDGSTIASGSRDNSVRLWDSTTGANIAGPRSHSDSVICLAFSPDGSCIASGSLDHTIRLWDAKTGATLGKPLKSWNQDAVLCLCFTSDGKWLVSGDKEIFMWDVKGCSFTGVSFKDTYLGPIQNLVFSPDDKILASSSKYQGVKLWHFNGTAKTDFLYEHTKPITSIKFSPDGTLIASSSTDGTIRIRKSSTGELLDPALRSGDRAIYCISFSQDGNRLAAGGTNSVTIWDPYTRNMIATSPSKWVNCLHILPDSTTIITATWLDLEYRSVRTAELIGEPLKDHTGKIEALCVSPDGTRIASGAGDNTVKIWDTLTDITSYTATEKRHTRAISRIVISQDKKWVLSASTDSIQLWDTSSGKAVGTILQSTQQFEGTVDQICFSPDSRHFASATDKYVYLWEVPSCVKMAQCPNEHNARIGTIGFSPDGTLVVTSARILGFGVSKLRIWRTSDQTSVEVPTSHHGLAEPITFSPLGNFFVCGHHHIHEPYTGRIAFYDSVSGVMVQEPVQAHTSSIGEAAFSPDGSYLVTHARKEISVWAFRPSSFRCATIQLDEHNNFPLSFTTFGKYLLCGLSVWDFAKLCAGDDSLIQVEAISKEQALLIPNNLVYKDCRIFSNKQSEPLLRLPLDFRMRDPWAANGDIIVIGSASGAVLIVDCAHIV